MSEISCLLADWSNGEAQAFDRLVPLVQERLQEIARRYMRRERSDHTLETAALVNEAYLRLVHQERVSWKDRKHFFGIAARTMRQILVDHARRLGYVKRGGDLKQVSVEALARVGNVRSPDLVALDDALGELGARNTELALLVDLRYFGGLSKEESAEVLGLSRATVTRRWRVARAWLYRYLTEGAADDV